MLPREPVTTTNQLDARRPHTRKQEAVESERLSEMSSVRKAFTSSFGRCFKGSCYGVGFVTSAAILIVMFWFLWFYLGLVSVPAIDGQRRALVNYSATTPKPKLTSPPTPSSSSVRDYKDTWNSTTAQNNIVGTRNQASENRSGTEPTRNTAAPSSRTSGDRNSNDKGDFNSREKNGARLNNSNYNSTDRSKGTPSDKLDVIGHDHASTANRGRYDTNPPRRIDEDAVIPITSRAVSSSAPENRSPLSSVGADRAPVIPGRIDYDAGDRRYADPVPSRRDVDEYDRRQRRPVDRDIYERSSEDIDRVPLRDQPIRDRDRRPADSGSRQRDYDDPPRRRYDDDEYDRAPLPPRRADDELRIRVADDRIPDTPRTGDGYRYRDDRVRDDRYSDTDADRRYRDKYDDDRYERSRPRDDRYRATDVRDRRLDDRYRDEDDRYRTREDGTRYRSDPDEDRSKRRDDDEYKRREIVDGRYRDRVPGDDDRYSRPRSEVRPRDDDIDLRKTREPIKSPDPVVERRYDGSTRSLAVDPEILATRKRDDYVVDRPRPYVRDDVKDDRYVDRAKGDDTIRDRPYRYKDDDVVPAGRDIPVRPAIRSRPVDDKIDDRDRRPAVVDDRYLDRRVEDRPYRRRDYDDIDEGSRSSLRKGEERIVDRDRPVYIAEDRDLSRSLSSPRTEPALDQRSYSRSDDDYRRNRPRTDPKTLVDDIDDRYPLPSRRDDDRDRRYRTDEDRYVSRGRYDDEKDYRSKGDYGRDRIDPDGRTSDDRSYSRKDSDYDDRYYESRTRNRQPSPSRPVDVDRPVRAPVERPPLPRDDYRPADERRYETESRSGGTVTRRDDPYPDDQRRSTSRDVVRPVVREKRDPVVSCDRSNHRGDCEESSPPRRSQQPSVPLREVDDLNSRPMSPREVIDAAIKVSDVPSDRSRELIYPVYDPRASNMSTPDLIRPSERRGTTLTNRKRRK